MGKYYSGSAAYNVEPTLGKDIQQLGNTVINSILTYKNMKEDAFMKKGEKEALQAMDDAIENADDFKSAAAVRLGADLDKLGMYSSPELADFSREVMMMPLKTRADVKKFAAYVDGTKKSIELADEARKSGEQKVSIKWGFSPEEHINMWKMSKSARDTMKAKDKAEDQEAKRQNVVRGLEEEPPMDESELVRRGMSGGLDNEDTKLLQSAHRGDAAASDRDARAEIARAAQKAKEDFDGDKFQYVEDAEKAEFAAMKHKLNIQQSINEEKMVVAKTPEEKTEKAETIAKLQMDFDKAKIIEENIRTRRKVMQKNQMSGKTPLKGSEVGTLAKEMQREEIIGGMNEKLAAYYKAVEDLDSGKITPEEFNAEWEEFGVERYGQNKFGFGGSYGPSSSAINVVRQAESELKKRGLNNQQGSTDSPAPRASVPVSTSGSYAASTAAPPGEGRTKSLDSHFSPTLGKVEEPVPPAPSTVPAPSATPTQQEQPEVNSKQEKEIKNDIKSALSDMSKALNNMRALKVGSKAFVDAHKKLSMLETQYKNKFGEEPDVDKNGEYVEPDSLESILNFMRELPELSDKGSFGVTTQARKDLPLTGIPSMSSGGRGIKVPQ